MRADPVRGVLRDPPRRRHARPADRARSATSWPGSWTTTVPQRRWPRCTAVESRSDRSSRRPPAVTGRRPLGAPTRRALPRRPQRGGDVAPQPGPAAAGRGVTARPGQPPRLPRRRRHRADGGQRQRRARRADDEAGRRRRAPPRGRSASDGRPGGDARARSTRSSAPRSASLRLEGPAERRAATHELVVTSDGQTGYLAPDTTLDVAPDTTAYVATA